MTVLIFMEFLKMSSYSHRISLMVCNKSISLNFFTANKLVSGPTKYQMICMQHNSQ